MDYEQRYKEALDEAKAIHKTIRKDLKPVIEQIFPELKESEDERIKKELIDFIKNKLENPCFPTPSKKILANWITWLEKQDEQNHDDKIEPKFHEGDWVVSKFDGKTRRISEVHCDEYNKYYIVKGNEYNIEEYDRLHHLWTIEDAKDGDILCTYECDVPKIVFILKGTPKKPYVLRYHCYYNIMYPYFESNSEKGCLAPNMKDLKPATKEQCDTLFEKMKLEGYRWDEDKKELIKFERFIRRKESDFDFKEDENGVIKFVHKES